MLPDGFNGKPWAADIQLTPDGAYLYASERTSSTLAGFKVDGATGKLTPVGSFPDRTAAARLRDRPVRAAISTRSARSRTR